MALRVLHCPTAVGGHPGGLAAAEREIGLDSWSVSLDAPPFGLPVDEVLRRPRDGRLVFEARRWNLVRRAVRDFDVVHFNFGRTILPPYPAGERPALGTRVYAAAAALADLRLLHRAGRTVVVTFQGDDARQGGVLAQDPGNRLVVDAAKNYSAAGDAAKRRMIAAFDRYADALYYLNPDLARVLPPRARFLPYASVDPRSWQVSKRAAGTPPVIVHAPSDRDVKGTRYLLGALEQLRSEGVEFQLELAEGRSRSDVRALLHRADLYVDQLLVGWYGGAAVEAMAMEIPVVAFIRDADLGPVPEEMRSDLPVLRADRESLTGVLRAVLADRYGLVEAGRRSRSFVERWHDPIRIAESLRAVYGGKRAGSELG